MSVARVVVLAVLAAGCTTTSNTPDTRPVDGRTSDCRCADGCVAACEVVNENTTYRKVPREPDAPAEGALAQEPPEAFDLWTERLEPLEAQQREAVAGELGRDPSDIVAAYEADFVRGRGREIVVVTQAGELAVYRDGSVVAQHALGPVTGGEPVEGIQLVDQRAEVVVRWTSDGIERLTVCRVIGDAVARIFDLELSGRTVEFVHLGDERAIRVHESDGSTVVYRWNPWEGVFRVPKRAPTAP